MVLTNPGAANVTITGGIFKQEDSSNTYTIRNDGGGTINVNGGIISGRFAIFNNWSCVNISGGEIVGTDGGVNSGTVVMTGGTVTASNGRAIEFPVSAKITSGTIKNSQYGVSTYLDNSVTIGGSATFTNNAADVYLEDVARVTISDDFAGTVSVGVEGTISDHTKRQITTAETAESMLAKVSSVDNAYEVNYDTDGKYLYLWKHTWSYTADGNKITARCTSDGDCPYLEGRTLTLTAPDMTYTGSAYDQASVTGYISGVSTAVKQGTMCDLCPCE